MPYAHVLGKLPSYLQQLEMESNGKSVDADGVPVPVPTGEIVWGSAGTNGQHAYFQLLHQGNTLVPVDFIGFARPATWVSTWPVTSTCSSPTCWRRRKRSRSAPTPDEADRAVPAHARQPPVDGLLRRSQLTPRTLGALVAAYEHKVFTLGTIWGIDSFDQWGVELGKKLAGRIADELEAPQGTARARRLDERVDRALRRVGVGPRIGLYV